MTIEDLAELYPEALLADGFEAAMIGMTVNHHHPNVVVYDYQKCVDILVSQGMTAEDAEEYLSFNTLGAYVGKNGPLFLERIDDEK